MAQYELAGLNPAKNKAKYEELDQAIRGIQDAMAIQDTKEAFVLKKIDEIRAVK